MTILTLQETSITDVAKAVGEGKTIVYPTETCYGLGADATNQEAVDKLFAIKKRQRHKTMLCLMRDIAMAREYVHWNETIDRLAHTYWPGPLTVVATKLDDADIAPELVAEDGTISFRISPHPFCDELMGALHKPLVSTSANISSMASPYDIEQVVSMFSGNEAKPDIIIDGGPLPHRAPSTIVKVDATGLQIIRQGELIIT